MNETERALVAEWQSRVDDLQVSLERTREERDRARDTAALLEAACAETEARRQDALSAADGYWKMITELEAKVSRLTADLDRLRRHYAQGAEL